MISWMGFKNSDITTQKKYLEIMVLTGIVTPYHIYFTILVVGDGILIPYIETSDAWWAMRNENVNEV